jgi:outer membrane protein TolC
MRYSILFLLLFGLNLQAQNRVNETILPQKLEFTFNEYLGYVKKFHPLVKTANLEINKAQASLMAARGAFDPKIEIDFDKKQFKDTEYYSILNSSFKIPTWYGIEIKAGFDQNEGYYR